MREAISRTLTAGRYTAGDRSLSLGPSLGLNLNLSLGLMLVLALSLSACGGDGSAEGGNQAVAAESPRAQDAPPGESATVAGSEGAEKPEAADGTDPVVLAQGEEIAVTDYLDPGKITIIDFYSEYCPPCRRIEPYLLKLHQERDDITVVKVDINRPGVRGIDWQSPVARQYGLRSIPHFQIYDSQGRLLAEGQQAIGLLQGYMEGKS